MSVREINPKETTRASAFKLWMTAPNPMVTLFKTFDVMPLINKSKKRGVKFNMLLDYCIGKAASTIKEFYMLPVGDKLMQYDKIAVNTIVKNKVSEVSSCDIAYTDDLEQFNADYLKYTKQVHDTCTDYDLSEKHMVIDWKQKFSDNRKQFPKIKGTYLEQLPIARNQTIENAIADAVKEILNSQETDYSCEKRRIDDLVAELYNLTLEEMNVIKECSFE